MIVSFEEVPETGLTTGISSPPGTGISLLPVDFKRLGLFPAFEGFVDIVAYAYILGLPAMVSDPFGMADTIIGRPLAKLILS